ncbi:spore germination protein [Aneurinibacillus thermoaerophilus]|uniref:spore germination protein n=1 Tax=Aneurinibacillus thermoaerophilus TaxID=143495 RepID=UPI002E1EF4AB|nr:spore germination protein [Aneurinibacillus thermoaerophilus]MED0763484.1 spore germination protein [Aneurinibacillus thermoaerophilus]
MSFFRYFLRGKQAFRRQKKDHDLLHSMIASSASINLQHVSMLFSGIPEFTIREIPLKTGQKSILVYMDGLVDKNVINTDILRPLLYGEYNEKDSLESAVTIGQIKKVQKWSEIEQALLIGKSILFIDGHDSALELETQNWPERAIQEPQAELSVKNGSHQGFIETSAQNIAMIRRYIPSRELKVKELMIGERGRVKISLLYLEDVANPQTLQEVESRITSLHVDTILTTGELKELIEDNLYTPFPQLTVTERPDTAASHLLEGRIAIVVDRTPGVLIGPMTFSAFFQTVDDYNIGWLAASFIRLLHFAGFFIAIFTPAFYIAIISFHYEVIPLELLLSVAESRNRVPFPPLFEALLMELVLEMLREAGVRLPTPIGQTIGVVGGIVIGQAAVQAGLVSNIMVIVVSITAIASFIIPNIEMSNGIRLIRFPMMLLASAFGIVGIISGMMAVFVHLLSLESLGVPYSAPISPLRLSDMKDTFVRLPIQTMKKRPVSIRPSQLQRQRNRKKSREDQ